MGEENEGEEASGFVHVGVDFIVTWFFNPAKLPHQFPFLVSWRGCNESLVRLAGLANRIRLDPFTSGGDLDSQWELGPWTPVEFP